MDCIECNKPTLVKESVKKYGTVYRRRVCQTCGKEFFTYEIDITDEGALEMCKDALTKRFDKYGKKKKGSV